jgi:hypothetical protein
MNEITIKILDKELTIAEARELYKTLQNIFEPYNGSIGDWKQPKDKYIPVDPYTVPPFWCSSQFTDGPNSAINRELGCK